MNTIDKQIADILAKYGEPIRRSGHERPPNSSDKFWTVALGVHIP